MIKVYLIDHQGRLHVDQYAQTRNFTVDSRGLLWVYPPSSFKMNTSDAWACHREWTRFLVEND